MTNTYRAVFPWYGKSSWRAAVPALVAGLALGLSACGGGSGTQDQGEDAAIGVADLADVDGESVGEAVFTKKDGSVEVAVTTKGMKPGFYGLHVHEVGTCEADSAAPDDSGDTGDFLSAGGHIPGQSGAKHPDHAGDLPTLLVTEEGTGTIRVSTDRLDESLLLDDDGAAVMIHSDPDNFANIPTRYAENGPDKDTTSAGDAGDRLACGVVQD